MCAYLINFMSKNVARDTITSKLSINIKVDEVRQKRD